MVLEERGQARLPDPEIWDRARLMRAGYFTSGSGRWACPRSFLVSVCVEQQWLIRSHGSRTFHVLTICVICAICG